MHYDKVYNQWQKQKLIKPLISPSIILTRFYFSAGTTFNKKRESTLMKTKSVHFERWFIRGQTFTSASPKWNKDAKFQLKKFLK